MRALVAEFAARDMGYTGVAAFLNCSPSAARNYVHSLRDERIVVEAPGRRGESTEERTVFRLNPSAAEVDFFLTRIAAPAIFVQEARVSDQARHLPARRDPLVAALFGDAGGDQP